MIGHLISMTNFCLFLDLANRFDSVSHQHYPSKIVYWITIQIGSSWYLWFYANHARNFFALFHSKFPIIFVLYASSSMHLSFRLLSKQSSNYIILEIILYCNA